MNLQHLQAFLWLHWRLRVNQLKRGGTANLVLVTILAVLGVLVALGMFAGSLVLGMLGLAQATPLTLLYVWGGLVVGFLFFWAAGLLADLQRADALSLSKFLHLPVSVAGVFVLNYVSSLLSLSTIIWVPAMVGLALGLALGRGPEMLLLLPLVAAFVLMVTAVSYQFQGWLASLMTNKRRRRTIIVVVSFVFVLIFQVPNLFNLLPAHGTGRLQEIVNGFAREQEELKRALVSQEITEKEYQRRYGQAVERYMKESQEQGRELEQSIERIARLLSLVLPPGWLALGAMGLAEYDLLPVALGMLGMALIGTASLWRAYRTTLRLYTGEFTSGHGQHVVDRKQPAAAAATLATATKELPAPRLLEMRLPWLPEQAAAIAVACFQGLLRAPEAKMLLLTPVFMVVIFGAMFLRGSANVAEAARPLMGIAAIAMMLLTMVQLVGNQFGFDRNGFRIFVLCPARRRDILLGKNLAVAPLPLILGGGMALIAEIVYPMRFDHLLALVPQAVSMYLLFCMVANWLSILAPMPMAAGTLKPANTRLVPVLLNFAFIFLFPLALCPVLIPLGLEVLAEALGYTFFVPLSLILSVLECVAIVYLYGLVLNWQGAVLQRREQKILDVVTTRAE